MRKFKLKFRSTHDLSEFRDYVLEYRSRNPDEVGDVSVDWVRRELYICSRFEPYVPPRIRGVNVREIK